MMAMNKAMWAARRIGTFILLCASLATGQAAAQEFPSKPLRLVVTQGAGTMTDSFARFIAEGMTPYLGKPVIVDNKPGAGNTLGLRYVAKEAPADGYTFVLFTPTSAAMLPLTNKDLLFDPLKDLPFVIGLAEGRTVLVTSPKSQWKTFRELFDYAKKNPGKLNYGTSAPFGTLIVETVLRKEGVEMVQVPYPAAPPFYLALTAGDIHLGTVNEQVGAQMQPIAVTGTTRAAAYPNAPTFAELGYPFMPGVRFSLNVPVGVPKPAMDKLYSAASQAIRQQSVKDQFAKFQYVLIEQSAEVANKLMQDEAKLFADIARQIGLKPQ